MPSITTEAVTLLNAWFFRDAFMYEKIIKKHFGIAPMEVGTFLPKFFAHFLTANFLK